MTDSSRESHEARFFELALEEEFGSSVPPDVSGRVSWEIARHAKSQEQIGLLGDVADGRAQATSALPWRGWLSFTAAAGFVLGCLVVYGLSPSPVAMGPTPVLVFEVEQGLLGWEGRFGDGQAGAFQSRSVAISVGDRWTALAGALPTIVHLAGFGSLNMNDGCIVEVKNVDWKAFGGGGVLGAVVVAVVTGSFEFDSGTATQAASKGDVVTLPASGDRSRPVDVAALQEQLRSAQAQIGSLQSELERTRVVEAPNGSDEAATELAASTTNPEGVPSAGARYTNRDYAKLLAEVDFKASGKALHAMSSMTEGIVETLDDEDAAMPMAELGALTKENAKILEAMEALFSSDIPGTGPNGQYTHPLIQSNLIDAMLESGGVALDSGQQRTMEDLTARFTNEDLQRRSSYGPETSRLEKLIGETELRQRYFDDVEASLRSEQSNMMHSGKSRGVVGLDLFSSGLVWQQVVQGGAFEVADRAELGQEIGFRLRRVLGAKGELAKQLMGLTDSWARDVPESYWSQPSSRRAMLGLGSTSHVAQSAQQQLELYKRILSTMNLSTQQRERLLASAKVFIPYRSKD